MNEKWQWYHIITSTYGSWLYGDARGFRTRHHREHIEGDYKNPPPPGTYEEQRHKSEESLKQEPVILPWPLREVVGLAIRQRLTGLGAVFVCISVGGQHIHLLAKMPYGQARHWMGLAKRHVWFELRDRGWTGKLWGKRGKELPVRGREHQLNVYRYILDHRKEGAWVWTMVE